MMKRIFCALIAVLMLLSSAMADEFVLRNGVKFGMSVDQVVAVEKKNGISVKHNYSSGSTNLTFYQVRGLAGTSLTGTLNYYFGSGKMHGVEYSFSDRSGLSDSLINSLKSSYTTKYGMPLSSDPHMMLKFPVDKNTAVDQYLFYYGEPGVYVPKIIHFAQWLYPIDNGGAIEIVFINYETRLAGLGSKDREYLMITYTYRAPEEVKNHNNTHNSDI